jgi:hypothetical protein
MIGLQRRQVRMDRAGAAIVQTEIGKIGTGTGKPRRDRGAIHGSYPDTALS